MTAPDPREVAAKLTARGKDALLGCGVTPLGNAYLRESVNGAVKHSLAMRRLVTGHGDWITLTPLGLAVRTHLEPRQ